MNKIALNVAMPSLLLATSAFANYVPTVNMDAQAIANSNDYKLGIVSTSIVMPFFQNSNSILFGDIRFSKDSNYLGGMHIGLGVRKTVNSFTIGLNGFYDNYIAEKQHGQYVAGFEVFNDSVKLRGTFYSPFNTLDKFRGFELESIVKLPWISLGAKPYYFFHTTQDPIKGVALNAKFEFPLSIFNVYVSGGYQFDTKYHHQAVMSFGTNIAFGQNSDGRYSTILPIERSLLTYNYSINKNSANQTNPINRRIYKRSIDEYNKTPPQQQITSLKQRRRKRELGFGRKDAQQIDPAVHKLDNPETFGEEGMVDVEGDQESVAGNVTPGDGSSVGEMGEDETIGSKDESGDAFGEEGMVDVEGDQESVNVTPGDGSSLGEMRGDTPISDY